VVLLDRGVLVVHVQARGDPLVMTRGAEPSRSQAPFVVLDAAVEDQGDLVGPPGIEVVPDDLLEEHSRGHGLAGIWVRENSACTMEMS
jgi:hypothetical protein